MNTRQYIALASDATRNDTLVFVIEAASAAKARALVCDYYAEQDWQPGPLRIQTKLLKNRDEKPVQFIGHAMEEYQALQSQIETLCKKLLEQADDADLAVERDSLYAFVSQFEIGKKLIDKKYSSDSEEE